MKKLILSTLCVFGMFALANAQQKANTNVQTEEERQDKQLQLEKSKQTRGTSVNIEQLKNTSGVVHIHQTRLDSMTEEDRKYILEHPEKFIIVK